MNDEKKPEEMALKDAESGDVPATAVRSTVTDAGDGGVTGSSGGSMDKKKVIGIGTAVVALIVVVAIILGVTVGGDKSTVGGDKSDCSDDGFEPVHYNKDGQHTYLKYKFSVKAEDEFYDKEEAIKACKDEGAELWEVTGGEEEWDAISKFMQDGVYRTQGFWLGAEVDENCPEGVNAFCKTDEAGEGKGLRVRWPVAKEMSTYSRLNGGANTCIFIPPGNRLWNKVDCEEGNIAPCVKRQCAMPETDGPKAEHSKDE